MANPQLEDGYTPIANDVLQALAWIRIPGEATQVLFVILRKTWGFRKKVDRIPLSQFCEATGLLRPNVVRAINLLLSMNLIHKNPSSINSDTGSIKGDTGYITSYCFNKDFETWRPGGSIKDDTGSIKTDTTQKDYKVSVENDSVFDGSIKTDTTQTASIETDTLKRNIYINNNKRYMSGVSEVILPQKVKHMEFVSLFPDELVKLKDKLGVQTDQYIARLNNYIGQIGAEKAKKKYVSHYHVILNWHNKDKEEKGGTSRQAGGRNKPGYKPQTSADRAAEVLMAIGQGGGYAGCGDQDIPGL